MNTEKFTASANAGISLFPSRIENSPKIGGRKLLYEYILNSFRLFVELFILAVGFSLSGTDEIIFKWRGIRLILLKFGNWIHL